METRSIWLITNAGAPVGFGWGIVKTPAEAPDPAKAVWAAAMTQAQVDAGYDATLTRWRRVPEIAWPGTIDHGSATSSLTGRDLTVSGLRFNLDTAGRLMGGECEDCEPDAEVVDQGALIDLVEGMGKDLTFFEKGSLKRVTAYTTEPGNPTPTGIDAGIYRQTSDSQVVRADA